LALAVGLAPVFNRSRVSITAPGYVSRWTRNSRPTIHVAAIN
jgi:hypothetical protein